MRPQARYRRCTRVRQSYHWRWLAGAIRAAPFMAGGPWPLLASLLIGAAIAYLATPPKSDPMNAATALMEQGVIATFAVLAAFVILQLVLTPRRMAKREQDDAEAREEQLRSHIAALTPAVADAVLAPDVLAVEPYREPRHSGVSPKALGLALGLEYRNVSSSRLEGCAVMWEKFESLVHDDQEDWSEVDWFERHWLTWDNTDEREARIATGQPRRVELVERYPGTGTVAYVRLPGHEKPWLIQPGRYRVSVGVVAIGYRQRPEQYRFQWADGELAFE